MVKVERVSQVNDLHSTTQNSTSDDSLGYHHVGPIDGGVAGVHGYRQRSISQRKSSAEQYPPQLFGSPVIPTSLQMSGRNVYTDVAHLPRNVPQGPHGFMSPHGVHHDYTVNRGMQSPSSPHFHNLTPSSADQARSQPARPMLQGPQPFQGQGMGIYDPQSQAQRASWEDPAGHYNSRPQYGAPHGAPHGLPHVAPHAALRGSRRGSVTRGGRGRGQYPGPNRRSSLSYGDGGDQEIVTNEGRRLSKTREESVYDHNDRPNRAPDATQEHRKPAKGDAATQKSGRKQSRGNGSDPSVNAKSLVPSTRTAPPVDPVHSQIIQKTTEDYVKSVQQPDEKKGVESPSPKRVSERSTSPGLEVRSNFIGERVDHVDTIWIIGFDADTSELDIRNVFAPLTTVKKVKIMTGPTIAFVT